jgi:molybdopterin converting factor small subunit
LSSKKEKLFNRRRILRKECLKTPLEQKRKLKQLIRSTEIR